LFVVEFEFTFNGEHVYSSIYNDNILFTFHFSCIVNVQPEKKEVTFNHNIKH